MHDDFLYNNQSYINSAFFFLSSSFFYAGKVFSLNHKTLIRDNNNKNFQSKIYLKDEDDN